MLSKIIKVVFVVAIVAYFSFWYLAIDWIDNADEMQVLVISTEHEHGNKQLISFVKGIWKIVPAIDFDKDAERLLKIASFSVIANANSSEALKNSLKNNYQEITSYYKKNKHHLSNEMQNQFALKRLIFINRSVRTIKDDVFETSLNDMRYEISQMDTKNQIDWYGELVSYYILSAETGYLNESMSKFSQSLAEMDRNDGIKGVSILDFLHVGISGCVLANMYNIDEMSAKKNLVLVNSSLDKSKNNQMKEVIAKYLKNNLHVVALLETGGDCKNEAMKIIKKII